MEKTLQVTSAFFSFKEKFWAQGAVMSSKVVEFILGIITNL